MNPILRHDSETLLSRAVEFGNLVFLSGIVADDMTPDIADQTRQVLARIDQLLARAGSSKTRILSATLWVADMRDRAAMNEVWSAWTDPDHLPARACVEARMANPRCLVEIMVTAAK